MSMDENIMDEKLVCKVFFHCEDPPRRSLWSSLDDTHQFGYCYLFIFAVR